MHLDYELIREHSKVFLGFSDITGMHLAIAKFCDLVSFYGPLATTNIFVDKRKGRVIDEYTNLSLRKTLFNADPLGAFSNPEGETLNCLSPGIARGQLVGGNLTLLVKTLGTRYELDTTGRILFMEDFGETLDALAMMLRQLADAYKFDECSGIVLGTWIKCGEEYGDVPGRRSRLDSIFCDILRPFGKPILSNLRAGHCMPMATLPFGVDVELNASTKTLTFLDSATQD